MIYTHGLITTASIRKSVLFLLAVVFFASPTYAASDVAPDPRQAIVNIKTYMLDKHNSLVLAGSGSGIIIDPSGLVLTNYHVTTLEEELDGALRETSYQICLTVDPSKEPDCSYLGQMVGRDKNLDVAILQIVPIVSLSTMKEPYPYLTLDNTNSIIAGDKITVLGYPAIGAETVTMTDGIVSGKINKYTIDWLKSDAVISFGSSGGAGLDKNGRVVGLTSQVHSDLAGTLGYLESISSLAGWISEHLKDPKQASPFEERMGWFSVEQARLKNTNTFESDRAPFSIVKPSEWDFIYYNESQLHIIKKDNDESGSVNVSVTPFSVPASADLGILLLKNVLVANGSLSVFSISKNTPISINGLAGNKMILSFAGELRTLYLFTHDNYLITVSHEYGQSDKDKDTVEQMIQSLRPGKSTPIVFPTRYESANPTLSLVSNSAWPILSYNSKEEKAALFNEYLPNAIVELKVSKLESQEKELTNDEALAQLQESFRLINNMSSVLGVSYTISDSSAHFKLNEELNDVIMSVIKVTTVGTNELLAEMVDYTHRQGDNMYDMVFTMFTKSQSDFDAAFSEVKPIMASLSLQPLPAEVVEEQKPVSPTPTVEPVPSQKSTSTLLNDESIISGTQEKSSTVFEVLAKRPVMWAIIALWALAVIIVLILLVRNAFAKK